MKQKNIKGLISEYFIFLIFIALVVVLTCLKPSFIAPTNLVNILKQASINGILAFGMMFVIIAGGFDMSVGSTVAFTGILAALLGKGRPAAHRAARCCDAGRSGSRHGKRHRRLPLAICPRLL